MEPALLPGDWLLLDPTCRRWPRPGSIVVVREPVTGVLAIKRVAARGGGRGVRGARGAGGARGGGGARGRGVQSPRGAASASVTRALPAAPLGTRQQLSAREGWVLGDSPDGSIDSRSYGPLDADDLVARAWFRYGPPGRTGRLR
jgi:signal peptidase I